MNKLFKVLFVMTLILAGVSSAFAVSGYLTSFNSTYPGVTAINTCSLCHTTAPSRNPYGDAFRSSGHNFRSIEPLDSDGDGFTNLAEINARTFPGNASSKPSPPPPPPDGPALYDTNCSGCHGPLATSEKLGRTSTQIQNAINSNTGGMGFLSTLTSAEVGAIATALASAPPVICTSFTYSAWGSCQPNGTQTRTVLTSLPAGCIGGSPVTSQTCTYVPPPVACTGYTYSAWSACGADGQRTRTVTGNTPAGCTGTPATQPVLTQACTPATGVVMPVPTRRQNFYYDPVSTPVRNAVPRAAKPVGVGAVATGGDTLTLEVAASFAGPVDVYLRMYTPEGSDEGDDDDDESPVRVLSLGRDGIFRSAEESRGPWKRNVTEVSQKVLVDVPVAELATGTYKLLLTVRPTGTRYRYYQWSTNFTVE